MTDKIKENQDLTGKVVRLKSGGQPPDVAIAADELPTARARRLNRVPACSPPKETGCYVERRPGGGPCGRTAAGWHVPTDEGSPPVPACLEHATHLCGALPPDVAHVSPGYANKETDDA